MPKPVSNAIEAIINILEVAFKLTVYGLFLLFNIYLLPGNIGEFCFETQKWPFKESVADSADDDCN